MTTFTPGYEDDPVTFAVVRETEGTSSIVRLKGEMDLRAATDLREALLKALAEGPGSVLLDLSELTFIDSTIISVLVMTRKRAQALGGEVRLRHVPGRIQRILAITGIDSLFPIDDGVAKADDGAS
ncbi:MAG: STAS domain-containing protein [Acidimicrobiales bacterium]